MSDQDAVMRLADAKAYLERRLSELEKEASSLRSLADVVDQMLAEKSFKRVEMPPPAKTRTSEPSPTQPPLRTPLSTTKGVHLADLLVEGKMITVLPVSGLKLEADTPPVNAFLAAKVLEPMKKKDQDLVQSGKLAQNEAFSYEIATDDGIIREIRIENFGDEKRLMELNGAIKWTLRRIYERTVGS